jgi:hypothetical protein
MAQPSMLAVVTFTHQGWHCWPSAPEHRAYLAAKHRHLFHFKVELRVFHQERDVEYHDLLTFASAINEGRDQFGNLSCETLALDMLIKVTAHWPGRFCRVSCFEDGECGAVVEQECSEHV